MTENEQRIISAVVKLVISVALSMVVAPLVVLWGLNYILEAGGFNTIPITLTAYFGTLLVRVGLLKVSSDS